jgi:hypothetical protein
MGNTEWGASSGLVGAKGDAGGKNRCAGRWPVKRNGSKYI